MSDGLYTAEDWARFFEILAERGENVTVDAGQALKIAAFLRAAALAEQGEMEWEYGNEMLMNNHTQIYPASSEFMAKAQAWLWPMYRRRKAGPWEAVPAAENNEREEKP